MRTLKRLAVGATASIAGLSALFACAAVRTSSSIHEGVPYFLPLTKVRYLVDLEEPAETRIETINVPDRSRPLYLSYAENAFADENICIDRTEDGLLRKVYFGSHDRLPDVILNVLEVIAQAGSPVAELESLERSVTRAECSGTAISEWMDPYDHEALRRFNATLCGYRVEVPDFSGGAALPTLQCPPYGVCFATKSTFQYSLRGPGGKIFRQENATVASRRDIGFITVETATFNKRITQLDFTDGALTTVRIRKDSEMLGLSELPLNAVERVLAVPGNAIGMAFAGYQERLLYLKQRKALKDAGAAGSDASQDPYDGLATAVAACTPPGDAASP